MSDKKDIELIISEMRTKAAKVGCMHSYWDIIADAEKFLQGDKGNSIFNSEKKWLKYLQKLKQTN